MQPIKFILALILLSNAAITNAETIYQVFDFAAKQDSVLNAARAKFKAEIEAKPQARALLLPNLSFTASSSNVDVERFGTPFVFDSDSISLTLTQSVFNYGLLVRFKQASTTVKKAAVDLKIAYQSLILRLAERYFAILTAIDQLEFARAEKRAIARKLLQIEKRFEVGLSPITIVHEARAARDLAVARVITAENELATRREALIEMTNQSITRGLSPLKKEVPLISPQPANPKKWTLTALQNNLALKSAEYDVKTAKLAIKIQRADHYPSLDLIASKSKTKSAGSITGPRDDNTERVELKLTVPLFSGGGTQSRTRQAKSNFQQAVENLEKQKRSVLRQTRDAYRGVINGISRVKALNQAIISSQSALKATEIGYSVGSRNIVDVFKAQQDLFKAKSDFSSARNEYIINLLKLKQAAGTLSANDLKQLNQWLVIPE